MSTATNSTGTTDHQRFALLCILVGVAAAAILYFSLPWGIGISPDSVAYLKAADRFATELHFAHLPSHWPPAYPLFLSIMSALAPDITLAALYGQLLLFAANTVAFSFLVYQMLSVTDPGRHWIAVFAGVVFACNPAVLLVHQYAVSEALFVFFLLLGCAACLWFLQKNTTTRLVIAALVVGCLPVTRYAGLPFLPIFAALLYVGRSADAPRRSTRAWQAAAFVVIAAAPLLCWLTLNMLLRGESTNRAFAYHPIERARLEDLLHVFRDWFEVPGPAFLTTLVIAIIAIAASRAVASLGTADRRRTLAVGLPIAAVLYVVFLLLSITFVDAYSPLDQRMLLPAWIMLVMAIFVALQAATRSRITWWTLLLSTLPIVLVYGLKSSDQINYSMREGLGFHSRGAATSELLAVASGEYNQRTLYSNAADYVFLHTGHEIKPLPKIYMATTGQRNPKFIHQMATILEAIDNGAAAIVYFHGFEFRQYYPTSDQLKRDFSLDTTFKTHDGVYFNRMTPQH